MTWTKLSDDFSESCMDLSDAAFRTHVEGLIYAMKRETGGFIESKKIKYWAESPHADAAIAELVSVGWWSIERQGYRINHHMEHQPEPELIARRRELTADRVKKHRLKKAGIEPSNGATERVTRDGTGRDGTGTSTTDKQQQQRESLEQATDCSWCAGSGCPNCLDTEMEMNR